jgi:hypothetical protein
MPDPEYDVGALYSQKPPVVVTKKGVIEALKKKN